MKRNYFKEITIGILSSTIFLIFVQPLINIIWDFIKDSSFSVYRFLSSEIIKQAAVGEYNLSDSLIMLSITIYFSMLFMRILSNLNFILTKIGAKEASSTNPLTRILFQGSNISQISRLKKFKTFIVMYFAFGVIMLLYTSTKIMVSKGLVTEFNQIINIISPYTSEKEIKILKSEWASMQKYEDFQKINKKLEKVSKTQKIIYPESIYFF